MLNCHAKLTDNHVSTPQIRKERSCPPSRKDLKSNVSNLIEIEASPEFMIPKLNGSEISKLSSLVGSESMSGRFQNDREWKVCRQ